MKKNGSRLATAAARANTVQMVPLDKKDEGTSENIVQLGESSAWELALSAKLPSASSGSSFVLPAVDCSADSAAAPLPAEPSSARYQSLGLLGKGGMGEVVLSKDLFIGRQVALKNMLPQHASNADARKRFVREAQIQGQLEHPAIVPVYDLGIASDGSVFFSMKCLRGRTLLDILQGLSQGRSEDISAFPRYRLLQAFASICHAVSFAHCHGVIHCDLKPANIMLGDFGEVYVLDWGLAKTRSGAFAEQSGVQLTGDVQNSVDGVVKGTLGYISPEQARAQPETVDVASDIFTLGVILFEILTLTPLREAGAPASVLLRIYTEQPQRPSVRAPNQAIPPELDEICLRATQKDPAARYATARELHHAVDSYLAGERDLALCRKLAAQHSDEAMAAVERALTGEHDAEAARRSALAAVGRALTLEPTNATALGALHRILTQPPTHLPAEVETQAQAKLDAHDSLSLGSLLIAGSALVFLIPMLLLLGVRDWPLMTVLMLSAVTSLGLRWWASQPGATEAWQYIAQLAGLVLYFCIGRVMGPLVLMTVPLTIHSVLNSLSGRAGQRRFVLVTGCSLLVGMVVLEQLGILTPSYHFAGGMLIISPNLVQLQPGLIIGLLLGYSVLAIFISSLSIGRLPKRLLAAERQQELHSWHMRQLLPRNVTAERPALVVNAIASLSQTRSASAD